MHEWETGRKQRPETWFTSVYWQAEEDAFSQDDLRKKETGFQLE